MNTTVAARSGPATAWHAGSTKALGLLVAGVLLSIWAVATDARLAYILVYAWFGVGYGLLLQYGRFCMASAVRDLFAVRVPRMAVGMMIAVGLYALVSAVVTLAGFSGFHPNPMGWHVLIGAAIFGVGWGLAGFCPGPALTSLPTLATPILVFVGFMLAGMALFDLVEHARIRRTSTSHG